VSVWVCMSVIRGCYIGSVNDILQVNNLVILCVGVFCCVCIDGKEGSYFMEGSWGRKKTVKEVYRDWVREWNPWKIYENPVIGMRGDHSPQVFEIHRVKTYRIRSWRGRITSLREMDGNGNKKKFLIIVGLEGRRRSWDFAQKSHTRCGRRRGRNGRNVGEYGWWNRGRWVAGWRKWGYGRRKWRRYWVVSWRGVKPFLRYGRRNMWRRRRKNRGKVF